MPGTVRIGISGWTYPAWRARFYPVGLPHRAELSYVAARMPTLEINGTFYALQKPESFAKWREQTPQDFVFSVKAPRFITHMKRLRDVRTPLANFFASGILGLGDKLGPILWQLPPTLGYHPDLLEDFCCQLPRSTDEAMSLARRHDERMSGRALIAAGPDRPVRHALEVRHASFATPAFIDLLRRQRIAVVVADTAGKWPLIREVTSDFAYVRLHGDKELYASGYSDAALHEWGQRIRSWSDLGHDVYVYFDNDLKVRAPVDALALAAIVGPVVRTANGL